MANIFKTCFKCKLPFPANSDYFHKNSANSDGLRHECKTCRNTFVRSRYVCDEHHKARVKKWIDANPERFRKIQRDYASRNPGRNSRYYTPEWERNWRKRNPEKTRTNSRNSHLKRRMIVGTHTADDVKRQYKSQKGKCYWCGEKVGKSYHVDHVIPVSKGGTNYPENIVIACPRCNISKGAKLPHEWRGNHGKMF